MSNSFERFVVENLQPDELAWEAYERRGLAIRADRLPPHRPGYIRGVHHTLPSSVDGIIADGLRYDENPVEPKARWTVLDWSYEEVQGGDEVVFTTADPRPKFGPGSVAAVLDLTYEEWDLHNSEAAPGSISPDRIVGVINGWAGYAY